MDSEYLEAFVQYGDWSGTATADEADLHLINIWSRLRNEGNLTAGEFIAGFRIYNAENTDPHQLAPVYLTVYIVSASDAEEARSVVRVDPIPCRCAKLELSVHEFFAMFKRFSIALGRPHLNVIGREFAFEQAEDENDPGARNVR